jgi:hypothetical protein
MDSVQLLFCLMKEVFHGLIHLGVVLVDDIRDELIIVGHVFLDKAGLLFLLSDAEIGCREAAFLMVAGFFVKRVDNHFAGLIHGSIRMDMTQIDGIGSTVHLNL